MKASKSVYINPKMSVTLTAASYYIPEAFTSVYEIPTAVSRHQDTYV